MRVKYKEKNMKKILELLLEKNRWAIVLVLILLIIGGGIFQIQLNRIKKLKDRYQTEVKLKDALVDTMHIYKNKIGELVYEKLTIQISMDDLKSINDQLSSEQKKLYSKILEVNKENSIITAALIDANFIIDSLLHSGITIIDTTNRRIEFIEDKNPDIRYDALVSGVIPFPVDTEPTLLIKKLRMPNEQFIEFHWEENKKKGYPISFSVTNTNKYVSVYNIESYAIPELQKNNLNPTGWQKFERWLVDNGKIVGFVTIGGVIGAGGTYFIMK